MAASRPRRSQRPRRSHSLGGCHTCRRRHVKCDLNRPACRNCRALGIECEGFSNEVLWMRSGGGGDGNSSSGIRRHLYTEQSRSSMSTSLGSGLVSGSIDASLSEIDTRSRDSGCSSAGDVVVGPFAVLKFAAGPSQRTRASRAGERSGVPTPPEPTYAPVTWDPVAAGEAEPPEPPPSSLDDMTLMDDFLHWSDLLGLAPDPIDSSSQPTVNIGPLFGPLAPVAALDSRNWDPPFLGQSMTETTEDLRPAMQAATPQSMPAEATAPAVDVLADAPFLFKHFQDKLIPQMKVMPLGDKCPWKILNLPAAVMAYSDITFLGSRNISNARSANLYAVLACAAIHLTLKPCDASSVDHWHRVASQAFHQAEYYMQLSLKHEPQEPKESKYKDQMMAICVLVKFAVISGQQQYARRFMVDAERVLRMRGLPKRRISQRARLLHHVYTWLRIVGESTYVLHDYTPSSSFVEALRANFLSHRPGGLEEDEAPQSDPSARLDDFLRLETRQLDNDLNIDEPKDQESGLHDIHLQDWRNFPETLYKQIYGIPETWLSLVSQTTRLANVMESFRVARQSGMHVSLDAWETLQRRSVRLENMICSFSLRQTRQEAADELTTTAHGHMLQALNEALVIFFYRRVRKIHPVALEGHVDNVISALNRFSEVLPHDDPAVPGTAWPAFIAGCEAITSVKQESITKWLDNAESVSGFTVFRTAKSIMFKLWSRQTEHLRTNRGDSIPTWVDVAKQGQVWPLLC